MKKYREKKELAVSEMIRIASVLFPEINTGTIKFKYDNRAYTVDFYGGEAWRVGG
jgi:hypothetical protein